MANTSFTSWALKGLSVNIALIRNAINSLSGPCTRPDLRDVLSKFHIPTEGLSYSEIVFVGEPEENVLRFTTEEGCCTPIDCMEALRKAFPDLKVRYLDECFEDDVFETNDKEGEFFPERYALDFETTLAPEADPLYYFKSEKELLDFVEQTFGKKYASAGAVSANLEYDLSDDDENAFVSLHEAEIVETLR